MRARSTRYVGWLTRHSRAVFAGTLIAVAAAAYLVIWHLPLYSDLSYLLPGDAPSVKGAAALARRMPSKDVMLMVLRAADPKLRAAAGREAVSGMRAIDKSLIERVDADDADVREFVR